MVLSNIPGLVHFTRLFFTGNNIRVDCSFELQLDDYADQGELNVRLLYYKGLVDGGNTFDSYTSIQGSFGVDVSYLSTTTPPGKLFK